MADDRFREITVRHLLNHCFLLLLPDDPIGIALASNWPGAHVKISRMRSQAGFGGAEGRDIAAAR
jgi:hypothetical protein